MNEHAAHLADRVLPRTPFRQWVVTLPWELARAVAYDSRLTAGVFGLFADELTRWYTTCAREGGIVSPYAGCVLEIQRFADGAMLYPHAHVLSPEGVFHETNDGRVRFHRVRPPRDEDLEAIVSRLEDRVRRLLERRAKAGDGEPQDPGRQLLLQCASVAPRDRVVIASPSPPGRRGTKKRQLSRRKHLCVRTEAGFELHAGVHVRAGDRAGLERLCRYIARPPVSEDRLVRRPDGRIEFQLKRVWKGGIRSLIFEPVELIARLAALIPLPRAKMRRFYGVFASSHPLRARVVPRPPDPDKTGRPTAPARPARMSWADLLKRVWNIDGLLCPFCGGRMHLVSAIHDPGANTAIIAAVHLAWARHEIASTPPRGPPDRST
jgi:hypothetical protein